MQLPISPDWRAPRVESVFAANVHVAVAETITVVLPESPSANDYWRMGRSGIHGAPRHVHRTDVATAYREAVNMLTSRYRQNGQCAFPSGDLSVVVVWHRSAKRGDLPNRTKVLYDALQGSVYADDRQIAHEDTTRVDAHPTLAKGFMSVQISRMVA